MLGVVFISIQVLRRLLSDTGVWKWLKSWCVKLQKTPSQEFNLPKRINLCVFPAGGPRGQGHAGQPPTVGHPRHGGGGRGAGGQRWHRGEWRWRRGQRLNVDASTHKHTHAQPLLHPPPHWLATHPLLTPQRHSRVTNEERQTCARRAQTHRTHTESPGTVYTHTEPFSPFILSLQWRGLWPRPFQFLFSTETCSFTFRRWRKRILWILTQLRVSVDVPACVCVWYIQYGRMVCVCVCVFVTFVCVCTGMKDGHTGLEDLLYLFFFSWGGEGDA